MNFFQNIVETFSNKINYVRKASMGVPKTLRINLALPIIDQRYDISGNLFYIWSAPGPNDYVDIKVNKSSEPPLRCVRQTGLITPYDKLLITTPDIGQLGEMILLYGTESPEFLTIIDNRSTTVADIEGILAELRGPITPFDPGAEITVGVTQVQLLVANADRIGTTICSDILNTSDVYLGFNDTVTTSAGGNIWFHVLSPGASFQIDDYRGPIHAIATLAAQAVGVGEW